MLKKKKHLRSNEWFGLSDKNGFIHRSWMMNQGFPRDLFKNRPIIGICNTWSELTPCNHHFRKIAEHVKHGIWEAGGFPLEFPVMSLGEPIMRPTTMLFRNLVSMEVEETIRANPLDGVVLLTGCDKTTPSLVMGAASCDIPSIVVSGGPMLSGRHRGTKLGSGTSIWNFCDGLKTGKISQKEFNEAEAGMHRSAGHCMTMGTASTMASMVEALGLTLPSNAAIPAVDSRRYALAHESGRRIVGMVNEDLRISSILNQKSFENAVRVNGGIGGSTNAVVHLLAIAGRLGVNHTLEDWDRLGKDVPCLLNLMPSGEHLMEDFYYAGGLPVVMKELSSLLHLNISTVNGKTVGENIKEAECFNRDVIYSYQKPFREEGGIAVLHGSLAPRGAVLKPSAASPKLMHHRGKAVVFENIEDYHNRIDDPKLDVHPADILVLKNCGPKGYPGFPETGNMALPKKILVQGIKDMVRISDARMSGTAYGTVVLHIAPEAAVGGPLALVKNGDTIELDVKNRKIHLDVDQEEIEYRQKKWVAPQPKIRRGWYQLYFDHVLEADEGVDLDFLRGGSGTPLLRESH